MEHLTDLAYQFNQHAFGTVNIWQFDPVSGNNKQLLSKQNLITKTGADVVARSLSGLPYTSISHIYVEHNATGTIPSVTVDDTTGNFATYARIPLAFSPGYANETGYQNNLAYFTVYVTGTGQIADGRQIVSLGLVAGGATVNDDKLFSRIAFSPIIYDASYGLTITWGITFRAQST